MSEDTKLVNLARNGQRRAIETLFRKHQDELYRFALNLVWFDRAQAQDLAQDTFVVALEKLSTLREAASVRSWLLGIAYNIYRNDLRRAATRRQSAVLATAIADEPRQTDDLAAAHEEHDLLQRALAKLAPGQREALYLREILGCSYGDTATILGISENAAKNRVHAGKLNVRMTIRVSRAGNSLRDTHNDE